ncbi:MAG: insulinase family protein [Candidatus Glassbacteria bacterium]|nr:insulinase family protein [Candidatus Glassbacteria bacterium]
MQEDVRRIVEDSGMRIVLEHIPHVRSCSVGVWIGRGSRHEPPEKVGISHFLEHMVFKGTERRNAREIASSIESVGGSIDAFTGREYTCFHARVLDEYMDLAFDVLSDLISSPTLNDEHMEREKQVVFEEIRNMEDAPDDLVHQLYSETVWGDMPLGYPLLGTYETVRGLRSEDIRNYLHNEYIAPNFVISVAGNIDYEATLDLIRRNYAFLDGRNNNASGGGNGRDGEIKLENCSPVVRHLDRDCQQTHICMGTVSFAHSDSRRYALLLLSNILGGGMSSRLFQRVREDEGLAYVVYTFQQFYMDAGLYGVYVGTEPSQRHRAIDVVTEEFDKLLADGVTEQELEHAKNQLKGQLLIGLESTTTRMFRLANFELNGEGYQPVDKVIERIEAVTPEQIYGVARVILDPEKQFAVSLGPERV